MTPEQMTRLAATLESIDGSLNGILWAIWLILLLVVMSVFNPPGTTRPAPTLKDSGLEEIDDQ